MVEFSGGCLCGAVRYKSTAEPIMSGHCHCEDCRRSSGTGHSSHMLLPEVAVTFSGKMTAYDRAADSGNLVSRNFCPTCGAAVFSRNAAMPGMIFLRASSLDNLEAFKPQMHVYAARAASWDQPASGVPSFAQMPPMEG